MYHKLNCKVIKLLEKIGEILQDLGRLLRLDIESTIHK